MSKEGKIRRIRKSATSFFAMSLLVLDVLFNPSAIRAADEGEADSQFKDVEIRVIRPKYFTKVSRYELGTQFVVVMNDTFVYTLMASGVLTYHFSETLALEAAIAIGQSIDRSEKDILIHEFEIKTEVFRTLYSGETALLYTPIYGKVQLSEGRLVYFDTFAALGAGMTGVEWKYTDFCQTKANGGGSEEIPPNKVKTYPNIVAGLGQRVFYSRSSALRWDLRYHAIYYDKADAACNPEGAASNMGFQNNITLQVGASKFF